MSLTVSQAVMNEVRAVLADPEPGSYWPDSYLCNAYNIVVTSIIGENPNALTKVIDFTLQPGVDQIIPSDEVPYTLPGSPGDTLTDGVQFIRMPSNIGGPTIRQVTEESLQEDWPDWYNAIPQTLVKYVIPDKFDPLRARVCPPNNGQGVVSMQYAWAPPDITDLSQPYLLTEAYRMDIRNGVLAMAYALNTDRQDLPKSQFYFQLLGLNVGTKIKAQSALAQKVGTQQTTE